MPWTQDYEDAKTWCLKAVQGRQTTLGKRHHLFYESVNLLAQIYDAKGDFVEAEGYKAVLKELPLGLQGTSYPFLLPRFKLMIL